jgi:GTPase SAR1 family protein
MVICVGAVSAGKSFLLSALCDPSFQQDSYIVPTVGVNIFSLNIDSRTCTTIRELGGALCAVWSSYIASETKLIFVVDSSDIASIALVATKLTECAALLEENSARENKVGRLCIVWTKLDRSASQPARLREVLCLQQLLLDSTLVVTEVLWDSSTCAGLEEFRTWVLSAATSDNSAVKK